MHGGNCLIGKQPLFPEQMTPTIGFIAKILPVDWRKYKLCFDGDL